MQDGGGRATGECVNGDLVGGTGLRVGPGEGDLVGDTVGSEVTGAYVGTEVTGAIVGWNVGG